MATNEFLRMSDRAYDWQHFGPNLWASINNEPEWQFLSPKSWSARLIVSQFKLALARLLFCSQRCDGQLERKPIIFQVMHLYRSLLSKDVLLRQMLLMFIPQSFMTGWTCFSTSSVISAFFSNSSWKVNAATVFLMIPPVTLISAASTLSTRKYVRCGWAIW